MFNIMMSICKKCQIICHIICTHIYLHTTSMHWSKPICGTICTMSRCQKIYFSLNLKVRKKYFMPGAKFLESSVDFKLKRSLTNTYSLSISNAHLLPISLSLLFTHNILGKYKQFISYLLLPTYEPMPLKLNRPRGIDTLRSAS